MLIKTKKKFLFFQKKEHFLFSFVLDSWWVILFLVGCLFFYEQASKRGKLEFLFLEKEKKELIHKIQIAEKEHERLSKESFSLNDPLWQEMILKKVLGLVHEDETKVYFEHNKGEE